jgi:propionyl-CoA synthetase
VSRYEEVFRRSIEDPEAFWGQAAQAIDWYVEPKQVLDDSRPPFYRWYVGGELNTCHNALDRHVDTGRADQLALIYDSPVTQVVKKFTYRELRDEVASFAGVLAGLGVGKGDSVVVYMPMVPEAVVAMLACARLGAIHSVVFGGFASAELAVRIDDAKPKVIVSGSCGIEVQRVIPYQPLLEGALELASHAPDAIVMLQRESSVLGLAKAELKPGRDHDWHEAMAGATPADCVPVASTDPLYVLYTSGTTAMPKGVVRDNGGHAVALQWSLPHVYDTHPGEVFWAASDVGWAVGHSYITYAPLIAGCTAILYEGKPVGTPDPGAFWRVASEHDVKALFCAPTAFRAIKKEDPSGAHLKKYKLDRFEYLFLAGERTDPDTLHWAEDLLGVPVIDHWWQTETGWPMCANLMGIEPMKVKAGSPTKPVPGYDVKVLDESGAECPPDVDGSVAVKSPLPPGTLLTLWNDDERFERSYFSTYPGYYLTGDGGRFDADGYLYVMGRIDDVINVAGHRLSTGAIEEVIATHSHVAECAVIGVADELKGHVPVGFVVLKAGVESDDRELEAELVAMVREKIGAVAVFKQAMVVQRLPKTRSGKILRATMRAIADGREYSVPSTIDDPASLDEIADALSARVS